MNTKLLHKLQYILLYEGDGDNYSDGVKLR